MKTLIQNVKFSPDINDFLLARENEFKNTFESVLADKKILLSDIAISEQNNVFVVDLQVYYRADAVLLYKNLYWRRKKLKKKVLYFKKYLEKKKTEKKRRLNHLYSSFIKLGKYNRIKNRGKKLKNKKKVINILLRNMKQINRRNKELFRRRQFLKKLNGKKKTNILLLRTRIKSNPNLEKCYLNIDKKSKKIELDIKRAIYKKGLEYETKRIAGSTKLIYRLKYDYNEDKNMQVKKSHLLWQWEKNKNFKNLSSLKQNKIFRKKSTLAFYIFKSNILPFNKGKIKSNLNNKIKSQITEIIVAKQFPFKLKKSRIKYFKKIIISKIKSKKISKKFNDSIDINDREFLKKENIINKNLVIDIKKQKKNNFQIKKNIKLKLQKLKKKKQRRFWKNFKSQFEIFYLSNLPKNIYKIVAFTNKIKQKKVLNSIKVKNVIKINKKATKNLDNQQVSLYKQKSKIVKVWARKTLFLKKNKKQLHININVLKGFIFFLNKNLYRKKNLKNKIRALLTILRPKKIFLKKNILDYVYTNSNAELNQKNTKKIRFGNFDYDWKSLFVYRVRAKAISKKIFLKNLISKKHKNSLFKYITNLNKNLKKEKIKKYYKYILTKKKGVCSKIVLKKKYRYNLRIKGILLYRIYRLKYIRKSLKSKKSKYKIFFFNKFKKENQTLCFESESKRILDKEIINNEENDITKYSLDSLDKEIERMALYNYIKKFLITSFLKNGKEIKDIKFNIIVLNYLVNTGFVRRINKILRSYNKLFFKYRRLKLDFSKVSALLLTNQITVKAFLIQLGMIFMFMHKYQHGLFFKFIKTVVNEFRTLLLLDLLDGINLIQLIGVKIVIAGRLKGKQRSNYEIIESGNIRQTQNKATINFAHNAVHTKYGVYGFHAWITYKSDLDSTSKGNFILSRGFKLGQKKAVHKYLTQVAQKIVRDRRKKELKKIYFEGKRLYKKNKNKELKYKLYNKRRAKNRIYKKKYYNNNFNRNKHKMRYSYYNKNESYTEKNDVNKNQNVQTYHNNYKNNNNKNRENKKHYNKNKSFNEKNEINKDQKFRPYYENKKKEVKIFKEDTKFKIEQSSNKSINKKNRDNYNTSIAKK